MKEICIWCDKEENPQSTASIWLEGKYLHMECVFDMIKLLKQLKSDKK